MNLFWIICTKLLVTLVSMCLGDVSHLKLSKENRQYLPPNHATEYHAGYATQQVPAAATPLSGTRNVYQPTNHLLAPASTDHVYYSSAPYSIFHTQINVQSQDNEYNAGRARLKGNATILVGVTPNPLTANNVGYGGPATNPLENTSLDNTLIGAGSTMVFKKLKATKSQKATGKGSQKYKNDIQYAPAASNIQQTFGVLMPANAIQGGGIVPNLGSLTPGNNLGRERGNSNRDRSQSQYQESNIQGYNILNSNLNDFPTSSLSDLPRNRESNIQGVNILNSNIFGLPSGVQSILGYNGFARNPVTTSSTARPQLPTVQTAEELPERRNMNEQRRGRLPVDDEREIFSGRTNANERPRAQLPEGQRRDEVIERRNGNDQRRVELPVAFIGEELPDRRDRTDRPTVQFLDRRDGNQQPRGQLPVTLLAEDIDNRRTVNSPQNLGVPVRLGTVDLIEQGNLNEDINTEPGVEIIDGASSDDVKVIQKPDDEDSSSSEENQSDTDLRQDGYHYKKPLISFFY